MKQKIAFITGISGQTGSYLAELLISKGYIVHGLVRRTSSFESWHRIEHLHDEKNLILHYGDMTDPYSLLWALKKSQPDEIYNLAAQSHVQVSWETPLYTAQTVGIGVLNLLEAVRVLDLKCKIYQASTSELFSGREEGRQDENTKFDPVSPYGTAKLYGFQIAKNYRDAYKMFICNGILFNHESERRGDSFVTKKITNAAKTEEKTVRLGNTDASRDWGYAPEYAEAMWLMLQQDTPDDYVIATGETHTLQEFVDWTSEIIGTPLRVIKDTKYLRPNDVPRLCGNPTKSEQKLGWKANVKGIELVKLMLKKK